jgi:GT2 family glycosyltransferase
MKNSVQTSRIVIIILTYNQQAKTLECLSHLTKEVDIPFSILVWDNGSHDETVEAVQEAYPQVVTHYHTQNLGVAGGRNAAARMAIADLGATHLLFLDNDIWVEPGFISALYAPFEEDERVGQTQSKLRLMDAPDRINDGGGARINFLLWRVTPVGYGELDQGQHDSIRECVSCGGSMMVRADVFQMLEGFDLLFGPFGPEDMDFSLRLKKSGYKALYIPAAVGYHEVSHTYGKGYSEDYARHKSRHWLAFMRRHATLRQKLGFYLLGAPYLVVNVIFREVGRGNWKAVRGLLRGVTKG